MAHYGNNLRTYALLSLSFLADAIDWDIMHKEITRCLDEFKALHSRNCMTGRTFKRLTTDPDRGTAEVRGFQQILAHSRFHNIALRARERITTFAHYEEVFHDFEQLNRDIPGSFGEYHLKMTLDHLVEAGYFPRRTVSKWPVAAGSGTAKGLLLLFGRRGASRAVLRAMLLELIVRLRHDHVIQSCDWMGSVGALLCWWERAGKAGPRGGSR
jgi:hypothetical protein